MEGQEGGSKVTAQGQVSDAIGLGSSRARAAGGAIGQEGVTGALLAASPGAHPGPWPGLNIITPLKYHRPSAVSSSFTASSPAWGHFASRQMRVACLPGDLSYHI